MLEVLSSLIRLLGQRPRAVLFLLLFIFTLSFSVHTLAHGTPDAVATAADVATGEQVKWHEFVAADLYSETPVPLPPAEWVLGAYRAFLSYADRQYQEVYGGNDQRFLEAVRGTQVYWVSGEKQNAPHSARSEDFQIFAREPNGLGNLAKHRFEMIVVEESKFGADGKPTGEILKNLAVKYAPPETGLSEEEAKERGVRVVFYNVDMKTNRHRSRIDPKARESEVYHSRINLNAGVSGRNVLWLNMDEDRIVEGGFKQKERLIKKGKLNVKRWWDVYWNGKFVPATKASLATGIFSATAQSGVSYSAFQHFGNPDSGFNIASAAVTWLYVAVVATYGKTYGNLVKHKDINKEVFMRTIIGLPLTFTLALTNHADFTNPYTYLSILMIAVGDKFASAVYSFWPLAREERGLTAGKRVFGFANQAITERELTAWVRMAIQQMALANDTNPHAGFRHLGNLVVWASSVPIYFFDLYMAKRSGELSPKMDEDLKRLKSWVNPKTYIVNAYREVKSLCGGVLQLLSGPKKPAGKKIPKKPGA